MNNMIGVALLVIGIVLLVFGFNESQSFTSDVSRVFTGNPTDRSIWMILGGAAVAVVGLVLTVQQARRR